MERLLQIIPRVKFTNLKANAANQNQTSPAESSAAETVSNAYASITAQVINYV
jgi:hypothetical protein